MPCNLPCAGAWAESACFGACRRLQEERRYRTGWCYHMLCSRWGRDAIRDLGIAVY